ncbi:MAG: S-4TM family putative pore-forming effector [bacterium]
MKINDISKKQNSLEALKMLIVQRKLHRIAKRGFTIKFFIVIVLPICVMFIYNYKAEYKALLAFISFIVLILNESVINPIINSFKMQAVNVQEQFDSMLFKLKWPNTKFHDKEDYSINCRLSSEEIKEIAKKEKLYDWYIAGKKMKQSVTNFQRQNLTFSEALRKELTWIFGIMLSIIILSIIITACVLNLKSLDVIVFLILPIAPLITWLVQSWYNIKEYMRRLKLLRRSLDARKDMNNNDLQLRIFQNEIIELRLLAPIIFDWYYRLRREGLQKMITNQISK